MELPSFLGLEQGFETGIGGGWDEIRDRDDAGLDGGQSFDGSPGAKDVGAFQFQHGRQTIGAIVRRPDHAVLDQTPQHGGFVGAQRSQVFRAAAFV